MKAVKKVSLSKRAAVKAASREEDRQRLDSGVSPEVIQRENSILPPGYFKNRRILNFASAVGK